MSYAGALASMTLIVLAVLVPVVVPLVQLIVRWLSR